MLASLGESLPGGWWTSAWLLLVLWARTVAGDSFVIVSSPQNSKVGYFYMPSWGHSGDAKTAQPLIDSGLEAPMGLAVDQYRSQLLVCDPNVQKIYRYDLKADGEQLVTDGQQQLVVGNVQARWVAIDNLGNIFFSSELDSKIMKLPVSKLKGGSPSPEVVYDGALIPQVSSPGGVAADGFDVYWSNKNSGTIHGSVVRANEKPTTPGDATSVAVLQKNALKIYGVCLAMGNVYYTDEQHHVYGVKKAGGEVEKISSGLQQPRGCAWDGDGSVFVADRGAGKVYSFAGNMHTLAPAEVTHVANFAGANGLAVLAVSGSAGLPSAILSLLLAAGVARLGIA